jgi:anti-sigma factor RsiW
MSRHASLKILAFYIEGALRPRKASRVASHLAGCSRCTGNVQGLQQVPVLLLSATFPPIPESLSDRIEMAIAAESTTRVTAAEPVSGEASRRDLPARGTGRERRRWRMPGVSSPLAGSLAAVGAAVVIAGGGYEIASHLDTGGTPSTSSVAHQPPPSGAAANGSNASAGAVRAGPEVQFQHNGKQVSISSVRTSTNFQPATLRAQAQSALQAARLSPLQSVPGAIGSPAAVPGATSVNQRQLTACVGNIAAGRNVLLVDIAKYQGDLATIIVVGRGPSGPGVVFAVGPACSATNADVLAQQNLPQTAP